MFLFSGVKEPNQIPPIGVTVYYIFLTIILSISNDNKQIVQIIFRTEGL